ncbi:DUF3293 domain-containing protein [Chitiniphilus purpureus]|uniref:DUF3293 domain-containing protein n=1 Tax=Chitiniphilus purpureus TaxID=2981137 RepID=A0ABY6DQD9_9NEIS|nr:DUF3293 domain-containing protein [Chitiniphilus sp. CD1]UXY14128.1 DUF3293 domain-containing protein [Chitiniphilus sp. CD1]
MQVLTVAQLEHRFGAAYRATCYRVPDWGVGIRIDARHPPLDRLLAAQGASCWAVVSASNPYSAAQLCAHENRARQQNLIDAVARLGYRCLDAVGEPDTADWAPEPALLVLDLPRAEALQLGQRFEQNAVLHGEVGGPAQLLWCPRSA